MITNIDELYEILSDHMDHSVWWDTENLWEIVVGSVLVQNTNWKNVDYSLQNIREEMGFVPEKLAAVDLLLLQDLIRPSGFYKNKSRTLKDLFLWFGTYDFDLAVMQEKETSELRDELLSIKGVGSETADVLLVFVLNKVLFVADRYAQRIFQRMGVETPLTYNKLQGMAVLPEGFTNEQAQNLHGWLVDYGQVYLKSDEKWPEGFLSQFTLKWA